MKWLTLLFKYAGKWHMDVFIRDACENDSKKTIRMWLLEATKLSIERQGLREKDCDVVAESMAFELFCMEKPDGSGAVDIRLNHTDWRCGLHNPQATDQRVLLR